MAEETKTAKKAENKEMKGLTQKVLEAKAKESLNNIKKGEKPVTVKLTKSSKIFAEFTKDVGKHIEKGHQQWLSELAYAAYDRIDAVKKI